ANNVTSFNVDYILNNATPVSHPYTITLSPCDTVSVIVPNVNISDGSELIVYTTLPNGSNDNATNNDTLKTLLYEPLNGTYTIGDSGANFRSFNDAVNALISGGVSGSVIFDVQAGTYAEQVVIPAIAGTSTANTVTFKSADNHADSVILSYDT